VRNMRLLLFPPSYPARPLFFALSAISRLTVACLARTPRLARMAPSHQKGPSHRGLWWVFLQIIKLNSWISAIQPHGFASLCQTPAEAKNCVTAIATRMKKNCLPSSQLNAARKLVSLNFLKDRGKILTRAVFIGATNTLSLVDSQHISL